MSKKIVTGCNNIAKRNTNEVTITTDGEGYISQRFLERLLHITPGSISKVISREKLAHLNLNENNQIHYESLISVAVYFSSKGNIKATEVLADIAKAGAKAFIYHLAGYSLEAKPKELTNKEILLLALKAEEEKERLLLDNKHLEVSKSLVEDELEEIKEKVRNEYSRPIVNNYYSFFGRFRP